MATCASCATENPETARFCMTCGLALAPLASVPRELRKVVTVVFADVTGSTGLGERLDPESLRSIMGLWFDAMRDVLERHGGTVEKFIGDAVVAVFGVPVLHEDDALRAVRAASEMGAAQAALNDRLRAERGLELDTRTGVNTGEVVVGQDRAGGSRATGDAVNIAARLQQSAAPGEVLLGEMTWRLVREAVEAGAPRMMEVKGREQAVRARSLIAVRPGVEAIPRRAGGPMVGRAREFAVLTSGFDRAIADETCVLVTVLGAPGVGKSRLVHEFLASVRPRASVLRGRCLPYGDGITWLPIAEVLRTAVGVSDPDGPDEVRERLHEVLAGTPEAAAIVRGLEQPLGIAAAPIPRDDLFWAVRRFVERLARERPVVVVLDDLQWAEPSLLDLVEHLVDWISEVPLLLLMMARPELLDARREWSGGKPNAVTFRLGPLASDDTERLIDQLLKGAVLPADARDRVAAAADGNPLYAEQLVEMLQDDGVLRRDTTGALKVGDLSAMTVPPTMQALLAARLDRLDEPERRTIERAAVVGKEFRRLEVVELTPEQGRDGVPTQLRALVRKELIRPDRDLDRDETYRFRHLLIRDAAYEGLPKAERAELHERFANWFEMAGEGHLAELDEIVGYHLDQAHAYRGDLGVDDQHSRDLALRAGYRLASAGARALERSEPGTAARLLRRAEDLLAGDPAARFEALIDLLEAGEAASDEHETADIARRLTEVAPRLGERAVLRARIWQWRARSMTDPSFRVTDTVVEVEAAAAVFEAAGDVDGLLEVDGYRSEIGLTQARWREVVRWAEIGMQHAIRAARPQKVEQFAGIISNAQCWGPEHVDVGLRIIDGLLARGPSRTSRVFHLSAQAMLLGYSGDRVAAEATLSEASRLAAEAGLRPPHLDFRRCVIERSLGDHAASLATAERANVRLEARGETGSRSTVVAFAGQASLELSDLDSALRYADLSRALAAEDDSVSQVLWRTIRAVALSRRGDHAAAEVLSATAVELALRGDGTDIAEAHVGRAECLAHAGRASESHEAAELGLAYWAAKGCVSGVREAKRWAAPEAPEPSRTSAE